MHVPFFSLCKPFDRSWDHLTSLVLGPQFFQANRNDGICPEKTRANSSAANYFQGFACCLAPSSEAISTVLSRHAVSLPPSKALNKLFPRFPLRPARCLAPFQRSSPLAISTVSCPSSMLSPSLPATLSATYLHGFLSVQHAVSLPPSEALRKLFARFPLRPACYLASSRRSSPQPICTVSSPSSMLSCCLAPSQRKPISTVSSPSRMLSRSLPAKLSANYLHGFLSLQHAVSLPPSEAFRKLSRSLPAQQAISTVSYPSSMLSCSLPAKLSASYFHTFLRAACCLPPSE